MSRFAAVLRLRLDEEERAKTLAARRAAEVASAREVVDALTTELQQATAGGVPLAARDSWHMWYLAQQQRIAAAQQQVDKALAAQAAAITAYAETRRARRTVELLRERDAKDAARAAGRREQRRSDDRAATAFVLSAAAAPADSELPDFRLDP